MNQSIIGILWMVITTILFVGVTATVRYLEGDVPAPQAAFLRYAIGTLMLAPSLISLSKIKPDRPLLNKFILRGFVHSIGVTLWFYAMSVMPVAEVTAIGFLTYIFVSLGASIFLKEKLHKHRLSAILISFVGALIILRPGFRGFDPLSFLALACAFSYATYQILTRYVSSHDTPTTSFFYTGIAGAFILSFVGPFFFIQVKDFDWFLILLIAILGTSAHFFIIKAYQLAQASILQPFNYLQLVFVSIIGMIFFNEILEIPVLIGSSIVVLAGLYSFRRDTVKV